MKNKDLTKTFWDKVSEVRIARGLTWDQLGDECGHTKQSLLAMKSMNKTPSFSFALDSSWCDNRGCHTRDKDIRCSRRRFKGCFI